MRRNRFAIFAASLAMASIAAQASAGTYECVCKFVLTGQSCSDPAAIRARATGVTVESDAPPNITDPRDPKLIACRQGCPQAGADFCSISWIDKGGGTQGSSGEAPSGPVKLKNPLGVETAPQLIRNLISQAVGIVGALALLIFIYGGLRWLTSAGEPAKIQAGKDAMKWAAIGLVVIFTSYALVTFVFKALTG